MANEDISVTKFHWTWETIKWIWVYGTLIRKGYSIHKFSQSIIYRIKEADRLLPCFVTSHSLVAFWGTTMGLIIANGLPAFAVWTLLVVSIWYNAVSVTQSHGIGMAKKQSFPLTFCLQWHIPCVLAITPCLANAVDLLRVYESARSIP